MSFRADLSLWLAALLTLAIGPAGAAQYGCASGGPGKILMCGPAAVASWIVPDWAPRTQQDSHTIFFGTDAATLQAGTTYTVAWPFAADLTGLVCDVVTAPSGAPIVFDVLTGAPLASVYQSAARPTIAAGGTSTLDGTPGTLIVNPTPLAPRAPWQLRVESVGLSEAGKGLRCTIFETHDVE